MLTHRVKTGERACGFANVELGVPLWVLSHYNPDVNLDALRIGQELHYPMLQSALNTESDRRTRTELADAEKEEQDVSLQSEEDAGIDTQTASVESSPGTLITTEDIDYLVNDFDMSLPPELDE